MRNILILTSGYCEGTANGLCTKMVADELIANGNDVSVITCENRLIENSTAAIAVKRQPEKTGKTPRTLLEKVWRLGKSVLLHTWTPQYEKNTVQMMIDAGIAEFEKKQFDAVVCFYFPLEAVIAGWRLKKMFPYAKLMVYELDSVEDGIAGGGKWNRHVIFSYMRLLYKLYNKADTIMVLKCHEKHWLKAYRGHRKRMCLVDLPLLKQKQISHKPANSDCCRFIYAGTLHHDYRPPTLMVNALFTLQTELAWKLDFYSKGCEAHLEELEGKDHRIACHGYVDQKTLDTAIANADVLLNIGNHVSNSLPSKLISYMTYGKPIIHFCLQENDVCEEYLNQYPLALIIKKNEPADVSAQRVAQFVAQARGSAVDYGTLCKAFPMNLPSYSVEKMLESLN